MERQKSRGSLSLGLGTRLGKPGKPGKPGNEAIPVSGEALDLARGPPSAPESVRRPSRSDSHGGEGQDQTCHHPNAAYCHLKYSEERVN